MDKTLGDNPLEIVRLDCSRELLAPTVDRHRLDDDGIGAPPEKAPQA
jgi:hypothetical protein